MEQNELTRTMKDIPEQDRPREKALAFGVSSLTNAELLATLIGSGQPGESVVSLCQRILADNDEKLYNLARKSVSDLSKRYNGIGQVKAINMLAALELGLRLSSEQYMRPRQVVNSEIAIGLLRNELCQLDHERLVVLCLDNAKHFIALKTVSDGGTSATVADVKMIMRAALEAKASCFILAHNHPSNNSKPSAQDDALTKKVFEASKYMEMPMIDHIVVTKGECYSYMEQGKL